MQQANKSEISVGWITLDELLSDDYGDFISDFHVDNVMVPLLGDKTSKRCDIVVVIELNDDEIWATQYETIITTLGQINVTPKFDNLAPSLYELGSLKLDASVNVIVEQNASPAAIWIHKKNLPILELVWRKVNESEI